MSPPPKAPTRTAPKAPLKARLAPWNPRDSLTTQIKFRGGGEAWYEVRARGRTYRLPGSLSLHDAMRVVYEDDRHTP